ncbi:MAG: FAD-dependent oxidoreductase [Propioniciclava sp.]
MIAPRPNLADVAATEFDLIVIGGGITGAATARDAALRGLSVLVLDKGDFASGTSSRSSKLIHGGLRYLETFQFRLVAESLRERERALRLAPHLTSVSPFLYLSYDGYPQSLPLVNLGLTFYDAASGQWAARRHRMLSPEQVLEREPHLNPEGLRGAGLFYDVLTDDARYTLGHVQGAAEQGAVVVNHVTVTGIVRSAGRVVGVTARDDLTDASAEIGARIVVNATGPWSGQLQAQEYGADSPVLRPSKGVHLVFSKADFPLNTPVFLRSPDDGRMVWPTPALEPDRVYVGTTDTEFRGNPDEVVPEEQDIRYLLNVANHTIPDAKLDDSHVIGSWAGLRPLIPPAPGTTTGDTSREHKVSTGPGGMITIAGGKLTSNRVMAKHAVDEVFRALGRRSSPYLADRVPIAGGGRGQLAAAASALRAADVPADLAALWLRRHGGRATQVLQRWLDHPAERAVVGPRSLTAAEIRFCVEAESCVTLEDLLVRRTSAFFWDPDGGLGQVAAVSAVLAELLGWDHTEQTRQITGYADLVRRHRPGYRMPDAVARLLDGSDLPHLSTPATPVPRTFAAYLFDMDGTIYLGDRLLPGVDELITALQAAGRKRAFLTNNSTRTRAEYAAKLTALGIEASPAEVVTSGTLTAQWLRTHQPDAVAFVIGEPPLVAEFVAAGIALSEDPADITVVVASYDRGFDYRKLQIAFDALRGRPHVGFLATHPDPYCPFPGGRGEPDAAAVIGAIEACSGRVCERVIGKPSPEAATTTLALLGVSATDAIMVGDRWRTDIAMGRAAGMATALVLGGDTSQAELARLDPAQLPDYVLGRIDALAPALRGETP